jgi:hypothetical protein
MQAGCHTAQNAPTPLRSALGSAFPSPERKGVDCPVTLSPMPVVAQALQFVKIRAHHLAGVAVECIYVRNVFDLADCRVQPAAIETISVEILADAGEVTLGRFVMTAVGHCPYVMMLDMVQILLGFFDDTMGATPVALLCVRWHSTGDEQSGNGKK